MFEIGEYVVYGNKGVCEIKKIGPIDIPGMSNERQYYTLMQVCSRGSTIFTPVDNEKSALRRVLSKSEAQDLIDEIHTIKPVWIQNDKEREQIFNEALREANTRSLFEMMVALYQRRERRIADGKKATSTDERYFHAAEEIVYGELGVSLGLNKEDVKACIMKEVEKA